MEEHNLLNLNLKLAYICIGNSLLYSSVSWCCKYIEINNLIIDTILIYVIVKEFNIIIVLHQVH
jgi:hypothetical protein